MASMESDENAGKMLGLRRFLGLPVGSVSNSEFFVALTLGGVLGSPQFPSPTDNS
jgi:hypothetical protein